MLYSYELVQLLHEDRLREVAKRRLYRQIALGAPSLRELILLRAGNLLIAFGNQLKSDLAVQERAHHPATALEVKEAR
jgi:hypothetical protein